MSYYIKELKSILPNNVLDNNTIKQLDHKQAARIINNHNNDIQVLISYKSLIAIKYKHHVLVSDYYVGYSITTTKHISVFSGCSTNIVIDHDYLVQLFNYICNNDYDELYKHIDYIIATNDTDTSILLALNNLRDNINNVSYDYTDYNHIVLFKRDLYYKTNKEYDELLNKSHRTRINLKTRFKVVNSIRLNNIVYDYILTYNNKDKLINIKVDNIIHKPIKDMV